LFAFCSLTREVCVFYTKEEKERRLYIVITLAREGQKSVFIDFYVFIKFGCSANVELMKIKTVQI